MKKVILSLVSAAAGAAIATLVIKGGYVEKIKSLVNKAREKKEEKPDGFEDPSAAK